LERFIEIDYGGVLEKKQREEKRVGSLEDLELFDMENAAGISPTMAISASYYHCVHLNPTDLDPLPAS
jgi:hypothetical protein